MGTSARLQHTACIGNALRSRERTSAEAISGGSRASAGPGNGGPTLVVLRTMTAPYGHGSESLASKRYRLNCSVIRSVFLKPVRRRGARTRATHSCVPRRDFLDA